MRKIVTLSGILAAVIALMSAMAFAPATVPVQPGDTLSGIAASQGIPLSALEAANPQLGDPNLIYAGQQVTVPGNVRSPVGDESSAPQSQPGSQGVSWASPAGLSDVPGVPASFAACVAQRESGDGTASADVYGIIPASGYSVAGDSLPEQKAVFAEIYAVHGTSAWSPYDGC